MSSLAFPAAAVIRSSIAAVWLYEGLWCKLLGRTPSQVEVVSAVPVALAVWAISGVAPALCAITQTAVLIVLNVNGLLWARHLIHEPLGMIVKNAAFLVLVWISGTIPGPRP
jgi:hypothetical protein